MKNILLFIFLILELYSQNKLILLTIDDGPNKYTRPIAEKLVSNNISAVWFMIGENVIRYKETVNYIIDNGFVIGNHTMTHNYSNYKMLGMEGIKQREIYPVNLILKTNFNYNIKYFRAPYGLYNNNIQGAVRELDMINVYWTLFYDSCTKEFFNLLSTSKRDYEIILLHNNKYILDNLDSLIIELKKTGTFVSIEKLKNKFQ